MELAWSEELSVGNAMIDSEHKNMIVMVNSVEHAVRTRDSFALSQAFGQLEHCLCTHFANEEKIAQAIKFNFTNNKLDHYYLLKLLQHMRDELEAKNGILSENATEHFSHFLSDWMTEHILKEDMLMKPVLQTYSYDFKPG